MPAAQEQTGSPLIFEHKAPNPHGLSLQGLFDGDFGKQEYSTSKYLEFPLHELPNIRVIAAKRQLDLPLHSFLTISRVLSEKHKVSFGSLDGQIERLVLPKFAYEVEIYSFGLQDNAIIEFSHAKFFVNLELERPLKKNNEKKRF